jgi:hypothetical protein
VRILRKIAISAFVTFHAASIIWWSIPMNGFNANPAAPLPEALVRAENALFAWKRRVGPESRVARALESYTIASATWQNWWMFAPNPVAVVRYLTVKAVVAFGPDKTPIYDPVPLWTSYRGTIDEDLRRFGGSYTHEHKFTENLTGEYDPKIYVSQLARFFCFEYERRSGRRPLEVHVICDEYALPPPTSGKSAADEPPREWVYWWYRP